MFLSSESIAPPDWFLDEIHFSLEMQGIQESELFYRENLIAPFMRLAWRSHRKLKVWTGQTLRYDDDLSGEPDYFISAFQEGIINTLFAMPLLAVIEAKRQDFDEGWGQCLAAMLACQKLNDDNIIVYGIVCTGMFWEFGKLEKDVFTKNLLSYSISDPAKVLGILDYIFAECEKQVTKK
ncbi:MAG: hypothetical protein B6242_11775 [Anaerolineaceae bacterium 4572_78]|nr:MAG: hypothetical protein B6242_11775 [Anaerolineaceae bacterium 4572_78]